MDFTAAMLLQCLSNKECGHHCSLPVIQGPWHQSITLLSLGQPTVQLCVAALPPGNAMLEDFVRRRRWEQKWKYAVVIMTVMVMKLMRVIMGHGSNQREESNDESMRNTQTRPVPEISPFTKAPHLQVLIQPWDTMQQ